MIKRLEFSDLSVCAKNFTDLFSSNEWNFSWLTFDKSLNYFMDIYNTPNFIGYVYIFDEEIIGCVLGVINPHFQLVQFELKEIFISNQFRNKGFGSKFLKSVEEDLKSLDVKLITLHTQKTIDAYEFYINRNYLDSIDYVHMVKFI